MQRLFTQLTILITLAVCAIDNLAAAQPLCESIFAPRATSESLATLRAGWTPAAFSDPRLHDPTRFRYLVHAIDDVWAGLPPGALTDQIAEKPELLKQNAVISVSVVDENHQATFGPSGFILRVPEENIFAAFETDMFVINSVNKLERISHFDDLFYRHGLKTPNEILVRSKENQFNEIVITGDTGSAAVEVVGVFINKSFPMSRPSQKRAEALIRTAHRLDLPIVEFSKTRGN